MAPTSAKIGGRHARARTGPAWRHRAIRWRNHHGCDQRRCRRNAFTLLIVSARRVVVRGGGAAQQVGRRQQLAQHAVPAGHPSRTDEHHVTRLHLEAVAKRERCRRARIQLKDLGRRVVDVLRATDDIDLLAIGGDRIEATGPTQRLRQRDVGDAPESDRQRLRFQTGTNCHAALRR